MSRYIGTEASAVALIGNPNVGKSTIFNRLTGSNQHTGNWPGKTVCVAQGAYSYKGRFYRLIDLPGTYSLVSRSPEESVAVDFFRKNHDCCTVVVCDATCLERNLALVLQLTALTQKLVVCVNLIDEAQTHNIQIDFPALRHALGLPVVPVCASRGEGMEQLLETVREVCDGFLVFHPQPVPKDAEEIILLAQKIAGQCVQRPHEYTQLSRADRILMHPIFGRAVMLGLLFLVFWLTIVGANLPSEYLQTAFSRLGQGLRSLLASAPAWVQGLLLDGIYDTVSRVISVMLPPMAIFFPLFTILEDLGYLPRVAFLLDHCFERAGACGKQALSMCIGFGCNAVGVVGCRIVDSPRERLIAIVTNALVPCNGRFPALILLITLFFTNGSALSGLCAALLLTLLVAISVAITLGASGMLSKTVLRGKQSAFAMELPPYRKPRIWQILVRSVKDRTLFVLARAVVVAAPAGAVLWLLSNAQILQAISDFLNPIGIFLGMNGAILLSFLLSAPANELMLPILCMILTTGSRLPELSEQAMGQLLLQAGWSWKTAVCVLVFFLFHWPCTTTVLTIAKETGKARWVLLSILLPTTIGVLLCAILSRLLSLL